MEDRINGKRKLDDDHPSDQKKFKSDYKCENTQQTDHGSSKKWNILPSVVYELLTLFKNSEKQNQGKQSHLITEKYIPYDCHEKLLNNVNKNENVNVDRKCSITLDETPNKEHLTTIKIDNSLVLNSCVENSTSSPSKLDLCTIKKENIDKEKITLKSTTTLADNIEKNYLHEGKHTYDINENVYMNQKCSITLDETPNKEHLTTIKIDKSLVLNSCVENSTSSPSKLDLCTIKKENIDKEKITLKSTTTLADNIEKNYLHEEKNSYNVNEHENVYKDQTCSLMINKTPNNEEYLDTIEIGTSAELINSVENSTLNPVKLDLLTNKKETSITTLVDNSKNNDTEKVNKRDAIDEKNDKINSKKQLISVKSSDTPIINIVDNDVKKLNPKTKTMLMLDKRDCVLNFLKTLYSNDMSKLPETKPPHCVCENCSNVDNLPKNQTLVMKLFPSINNLHHNDHNNKEQLNNNKYSLKKEAVSNSSICTPKYNCKCINKSNSKNYTSKDVWVNQLISMMKQNEKKYSAPKNNDTSKPPNKTIMGKVRDTAERIKSHFNSKSYNFGKNSKISDKFNAHVKKNKYNEKLPYKKDSFRRYRNNRYQHFNIY